MCMQLRSAKWPQTFRLLEGIVVRIQSLASPGPRSCNKGLRLVCGPRYHFPQSTMLQTRVGGARTDT